MKYVCYLLVGLLLFIIGCAINPVTGKREIMIFSDSQEIDFGKNADPDIRWEFGGVYGDSQLSNYVNSVGQRVAMSCDRPKIPYHFTVVDTSVINAFALPGGYIYITRGLLVRLDNEAQLAAVLGHEIGHVNARHSMKRLQQNMGFNVLLAIVDQVAGGSKNYQETRGLIRTGSSIAFAAVSLGYGRENELEADALGTKYSSKAGYDPSGMVQLLGVLKSLNEREPSSVEEFFMSHPKTSDRIKSVNEFITKIPADQKGNTFAENDYKSSMSDLIAAQKAYDYYDKGEEYRAKGDYNNALAQYSQALRLRQISKPHHGIGLVNRIQEKYDQAINSEKKAVQIDADYILAYNSMGIAYIKMKQYDNALSPLKKSVGIYENFDDAWANLGEVYYNLKQYTEATKSLEMATTLNPNHPRAHTTLGLTYEATGNSQKAIEEYEKAVQIAPKDSYTETARQRLTELKKTG